jgi:hypothetical protein
MWLWEVLPAKAFQLHGSVTEQTMACDGSFKTRDDISIENF